MEARPDAAKAAAASTSPSCSTHARPLPARSPEQSKHLGGQFVRLYGSPQTFELRVGHRRPRPARSEADAARPVGNLLRGPRPAQP